MTKTHAQPALPILSELTPSAALRMVAKHDRWMRTRPVLKARFENQVSPNTQSRSISAPKPDISVPGACPARIECKLTPDWCGMTSVAEFICEICEICGCKKTNQSKTPFFAKRTQFPPAREPRNCFTCIDLPQNPVSRKTTKRTQNEPKRTQSYVKIGNYEPIEML